MGQENAGEPGLTLEPRESWGAEYTLHFAIIVYNHWTRNAQPGTSGHERMEEQETWCRFSPFEYDPRACHVQESTCIDDK
jgi:hypothetical protein